MKRAFVFILLIVIIGLSASFVQADIGVWSSYVPDVGKNVTALATDQTKTPMVIYAGTSEGIFRITQGQNSWSSFNDGLTNSNIRSLAIDQTKTPSMIYAGTYGGIFKAPNENGNWSAFVPEKTIYALALSPQNSDMLYAAVFYTGIFGSTISKITDGGSNWADITQIERKDVFALVSDPQTPDTLYAGTAIGGVYKSTNGGVTWDNLGLTGNIVYGLVIDQAGIIYAGTDGSGVFKSMDGGKSWYEINTGLTNKKVKALAIVQTKPITLYAATDGGGIFNITLPAVLGDVNDDGTVNLADATLALRIIAGIAGANEKINPNADVNGDKKIGIAEVAYILQVVAKLRQ